DRAEDDHRQQQRDEDGLDVVHQAASYRMTPPTSVSRISPRSTSRSTCPSTSDSVRYACVTATLPHSDCAISYALIGLSAISPPIFAARRSCSAKRSSISLTWSVTGSP